MPRGHGSFSQVMLFLFVLKNANAFWSAKVPKALYQSSNGPLTQSRHTSKKQRHFVLCSQCLVKDFAKTCTKPLRFRFGSGRRYYYAPVFLISPALGIDGVLR
jgi:hypothetical protein